MSHLKINDPAPDFEAIVTDGRHIRLSQFKGKNVVLYFYPKDNTPGCTNEARDFQALLPEFEKQNTKIIGVSRDSQASHQKFRDKLGLTFDLISDVDGTVCQAYGVLKPKQMFGREYMGIVRSTFLIDAQGTIRGIWSKVKVNGHAKSVLDTIIQMD